MAQTKGNIMAKLAPQKIPDEHKLMLENMAELYGESIASVVRGIIREEYIAQTESPVTVKASPPI